MGIEYPDPETGAECVLQSGQTLPGATLQVWLYTPQSPRNGSVPIGVEEYRWGIQEVTTYGPNGTVTRQTVPAMLDVVWSNASVPMSAGEFYQFNLNVPPVYASPTSPENLSLFILGLDLSYMIATPGTAMPVPETVGGLIAWLALMSPVAVVVFLGGFVPGEWFVRRLRYVSTGRYAAAFSALVSGGVALGVLGNFAAFLYWLGNVGISGLALLLLFPLFLWGIALWVTVRGKRLKVRFIRSPIARTEGGDPVAGMVPVRIYGGGGTGHPEELVEGLGVGGLKAAWYRLLGVSVAWNPRKIAREPRLIRYEWASGRFPAEGEYAAWPSGGGTKVDVQIRRPETVWFPWRKSVRARYDPAPDPEDGDPVPPTVDRSPELWAHRGFFLGFRHGEASTSALGSPDYVGPDQYIRGVAPAAEFGREAQRRGTALVLMNERTEAEAWDRAMEINAIQDRLGSFPGSPEAMEGVRRLSTRIMSNLFDPDAFMRRLEERGRERVDYHPPGAKRYATSSVDLQAEATNPVPPDMRGGARGGSGRASR